MAKKRNVWLGLSEKEVGYKEVEKHKDSFIEALKKENLKFTNQRFAIFEEILYGSKHRECEQILEALTKRGLNVSRATVYRTLDILIKYDFIRKMDIEDGRVRYESNIGREHPQHDHMICVETGKIVEFYSEEIAAIQAKIAQKNGYKIIKHNHQIFVKPLKK
tara:strand:- start:573 stop:1061 length:489 start_codon:yes stop_codon:yes gene_type:complete